MDKARATDLVELLSVLDDPCALDGRRHRLGDILVIAFCTVLCGYPLRRGQSRRPAQVRLPG